MEAAFCVDCFENALRVHGKPEVFNSDQGVQFSSEPFTGVLKHEEISISMDARMTTSLWKDFGAALNMIMFISKVTPPWASC